MNLPPRRNVLGVGVHALNLSQATEIVISAARSGQPGYVCCCDVNSVSWARRDSRHKDILNRSLLTTPDGMPIVWLARQGSALPVSRVYGPDLLLEVCRATAGQESGHYFYGAAPGTADLLAESLRRRFPKLRIVGTRTPPQGRPGPAELDALQQELERTAPDFIWVGLSTPLQEAFMADFLPRLSRGVLLGVGAAFDFHSGRVRQAPRLVQRSGFEWLWRMAMEPRRLGPRYFRNNPLFLLHALGQLSGLRSYSMDPSATSGAQNNTP